MFLQDIMKDECSMLKLQLKEKDELISQLQEELVSVNNSCPMGVFSLQGYLL